MSCRYCGRPKWAHEDIMRSKYTCGNYDKRVNIKDQLIALLRTEADLAFRLRSVCQREDVEIYMAARAARIAFDTIK